MPITQKMISWTVMAGKHERKEMLAWVNTLGIYVIEMRRKEVPTWNHRHLKLCLPLSLGHKSGRDVVIVTSINFETVVGLLDKGCSHLSRLLLIENDYTPEAGEVKSVAVKSLGFQSLGYTSPGRETL